MGDYRVGVEQVQVEEYPKPLSTVDMLLESLGASERVFTGTALEGVERAFKDLSTTDAGKAYARIPYEITVR